MVPKYAKNGIHVPMHHMVSQLIRYQHPDILVSPFIIHQVNNINSRRQFWFRLFTSTLSSFYVTYLQCRQHYQASKRPKLKKSQHITHIGDHFTHLSHLVLKALINHLSSKWLHQVWDAELSVVAQAHADQSILQHFHSFYILSPFHSLTLSFFYTFTFTHFCSFTVSPFHTFTLTDSLGCVRYELSVVAQAHDDQCKILNLKKKRHNELN